MSKIDTLEPDFKEQIQQLLQATEGVTGRKWVVTDGRRTMAEQRKLYNQGRTTKGKVVTNAQAGSSAHNFGYAADLAPLATDGKTIDWNAPKEIWKRMADIAIEMGLTAGFYFHTIFDAPHIESPKWKIVQAQWKEGKVQVV